MQCRRSMREPCWLLTGLGIVLVIGLAGCSGRTAPAHVRGKVAYKDGSIPQAEVCIVRFEPIRDSSAPVERAATGDIARDGSFDIYTKKPGDGVLPGTYAVTFTVLKSHFDPESLTAEKYTKADTTPYKITVDQDLDNQVFEIEPIEPPSDEAATPSGESSEQPNG